MADINHIKHKICPLCKAVSEFYSQERFRRYFRCENCYSVFLDREDYLSEDKEIARYDLHNYDLNDLGHQRFVAPIINAVLSIYSIDAKGLDFGCGKGSVFTKLLRDAGYKIEMYDPFFANNKEALELDYDFIVCCEVIEHFKDPASEFKNLKSLLKPNGKLICMTDLYREGTNFKDWYYKNDPTHLFFYSQQTLKWIEGAYNFSELYLNERLIIFSTN